MIDVKRAYRADPLVKLVRQDSFVGWVYEIDYDVARVMTSDLWKKRALGVPHNSFLTAASFHEDTYAETPDADRSIILLRVVGSSRLPAHDDLLQAKIDHFQRQPSTRLRDYDDLTKNQLQFGGLECRVLGAFYRRDGVLRLGSDLENYEVAGSLNVFRPRGDGLAAIVNYLDPDLAERAAEEAAQRGIDPSRAREVRFQIGSVRYTSTDLIHRSADTEMVPVYFQATDFLARRTGIFGMTRSGKSNTVKHLISVVKQVADDSGAKIGQLIYDLRGEYANPNTQDRGSIASVYPGDVECYRMVHSKGFRLLQGNFYLQLQEGMATVRDIIRENPSSSAQDIRIFLDCTFAEPPEQERGLHYPWQVKVAAYRTMLYKAGFEPPDNFLVKFQTNDGVRRAVRAALGDALGDKDPKFGLTLNEAVRWFEAARSANRVGSGLTSSGGGPWLDSETNAILNMLAQKNANDAFINGFRVLSESRKYHAKTRERDVADEIYEFLQTGKVVILDLSVGPVEIRDRITKKIAARVFEGSQGIFLEGRLPPSIVIYVEEAHNLVSKDAKLTDIWPTIAKEGAKFGIAFVMSTQEPSSIHSNILANTENWVVTHLNNDDEIRHLSKFYDFADFAPSLKHATDVGFARVRTLSSKFVIPVQIDKFDPESLAKQRKAGQSLLTQGNSELAAPADGPSGPKA